MWLCISPLFSHRYSSTRSLETFRQVPHSKTSFGIWLGLHYIYKNNLGRIDIFTELNLPIQLCRVGLHAFWSFSVSLDSVDAIFYKSLPFFTLLLRWLLCVWHVLILLFLFFFFCLDSFFSRYIKFSGSLNFNSVKMSISPRYFYKYNAIPIKFQTMFLNKEPGKTFLNFTWKNI